MHHTCFADCKQNLYCYCYYYRYYECSEVPLPCEEMTMHHMWMVQVVSVRSTTTRKKCSSNAAVCRLTNPSRFDWLSRSAVSRRDPVISCSWNMWINSMFRQSCHTTRTPVSGNDSICPNSKAKPRAWEFPILVSTTRDYVKIYVTGYDWSSLSTTPSQWGASNRLNPLRETPQASWIRWLTSVRLCFHPSLVVCGPLVFSVFE